MLVVELRCRQGKGFKNAEGKMKVKFFVVVQQRLGIQCVLGLNFDVNFEKSAP